MKPLLAHTVDSLDSIRFPVLASPKLDGIRCLVLNGVAVSRSLKPIPNDFIRSELAGLPPLDGELIIGDPTAPDCFNRSTSAVMSKEGEPDFKLYAFDVIEADPPPHYPFSFRLEAVKRCHHPRVLHVLHKLIPDKITLAEYEFGIVQRGFEGVMIRDPDGIYKHGRSTAREGILGKVKRFADTEATVIGFEELQRNGNEATTNALGLTERSTAKAGLVGGDTLGALVVTCPEFAEPFKLGTGYTAEQRAEFWRDRESLVGRLVKFKHQPAGAKDLPRFPVFIGFRGDE